jgi:hypothetical protein
MACSISVMPAFAADMSEVVRIDVRIGECLISGGVASRNEQKCFCSSLAFSSQSRHCDMVEESETITPRGGGAAGSLRQHRVDAAAQFRNNGSNFAVGESFRRAIASTPDIALEVLENLLLLNHHDFQPRRIKSLCRNPLIWPQRIR